MKKVFRVIKGVAKGVRDILPVPSTDAERATIYRGVDEQLDKLEALAEKLTSRGMAVAVLVYLLDEFFKLGLFV